MNCKTIILISLPFLLFQSCSNNPESFNVQAVEAKEVVQAVETMEVYTIDAEKSIIKWVGTKVIGQHKGILRLNEGKLSVQNDQIESGNVIIDMRSLKVTDMKEKRGVKLTSHLMDDDFFNVEKYQTTTVEILKVVPITANTSEVDPEKHDATNQNPATHEISANLTMMDSTKMITFPAFIELRDNEIVTTANFNIDRTQWGLHYKAASSFGDKRIYPMVNIEIEIFAVKE